MDNNKEQNLVIYNSKDGKVHVAMYAAGGFVWQNRKQPAELLPPLYRMQASI